MFKAFGAAFGLTFIAELGDKTQLAILTLSARYSFLPVFLGAAIAFVILNALAVTVGALVAKLLPESIIRYVAALSFIVFGALTLSEDAEEVDGKEGEKQGRGPLLTSLLMVALMELGDKTQLSLVALTSKYRYPLFIFLGGTLALWATSLIGALVGEGLSRIVPLEYVRVASGVIFIAFGILMAVEVI